MEIVIASIICSIIASIVTSLIITRESLNIIQSAVDRIFDIHLEFVSNVTNMIADKFRTDQK